MQNFDLQALEDFEAQLYKGEIASEDLDGDELDDSDEGVIRSFVIPAALHNTRIDVAVATLLPELSRSMCSRLVSDGRVHISSSGKRELVVRKSHKVCESDELDVIVSAEPPPFEILPQALPLDILFEDEHMIVINKAAGMVVHPAAGNWDGTVVNALAFHLRTSAFGHGEFAGLSEGEGAPMRPGIVHRLDKGTTGVLVVAKTALSLARLSKAFADRQAKKTYVAITVGNPGNSVTIDKPVGRHPIHRQRMRVVPDPHPRGTHGATLTDSSLVNAAKGRQAVSHVDTIAFDGRLALVKVMIDTGRTHQIRVHLQDRRTPIYGDDVYGIDGWNKQLSKQRGTVRPLLHAYELELDHPTTGERMTFRAPLPEDMAEIARAVYPEVVNSCSELFAAKESQ